MRRSLLPSDPLDAVLIFLLASVFVNFCFRFFKNQKCPTTTTRRASRRPPPGTTTKDVRIIMLADHGAVGCWRVKDACIDAPTTTERITEEIITNNATLVVAAFNWATSASSSNCALQR